MIALGIMCLLVVGIALDLVAPLLPRYLVDDVLQGSPEASQEFKHEPIVLTEHIKMPCGIFTGKQRNPVASFQFVFASTGSHLRRPLGIIRFQRTLATCSAQYIPRHQPC